MTKLGVQNSVMGWDDPWHVESSKKLMRTGEGRYFASQDTMPSKEAFLRFIKEKLGVDFYMAHVMPDDGEIGALIDDLAKFGIDFMFGNEFGNINRVYSAGFNRYDIPPALVKKARETGRLIGLLYDETDHLQMNNTQYQPDPAIYQWGNPGNLTIDGAEDECVKNIAALRKMENCEIFAEEVFGMHHALARGGFNLSPKAMKEVRQSSHFASAMGAVKEYNRKMSVTVDLWGPDIGDWFTRMWGFPGHSPAEFKNALMMTYLLGPDYMFVENCDALMMSTSQGLKLTEFGEIYRDFIERAKTLNRPYDVHSATCDIAVVCADDCVLSRSGTFTGGPYGSKTLRCDEKTGSLYDVIHVLSHGTISPLASTMFATNEIMPAVFKPRDAETLKTFPREKGVSKEEATLSHPLFYPLNQVLVFDDRVPYNCLSDAELVIVCGSRLSGAGRKSVIKCAENGKRVIIADWLSGGMKESPRLMIIESFTCGRFKDAMLPYIGRKDEWNIKYKAHELKITNPSNDGISLEFEIK